MSKQIFFVFVCMIFSYHGNRLKPVNGLFTTFTQACVLKFVSKKIKIHTGKNAKISYLFCPLSIQKVSN